MPTSRGRKKPTKKGLPAAKSAKSQPWWIRYWKGDCRWHIPARMLALQPQSRRLCRAFNLSHRSSTWREARSRHRSELAISYGHLDRVSFAVRICRSKMPWAGKSLA